MAFSVRSWSRAAANNKKLTVLAIFIVLIGGRCLYTSWFSVKVFESLPAAPVDSEFTRWTKLKPEMDDPNFVEFVRKNYIYPPSEKPYNLSIGGKKDPSAGQAKLALSYLPNSPGFFIECGAADGEYLSNTLYLEKELGWTGLLVEAEPTLLQRLLAKNRKAWIAPTCLSLEKYPVVGTFYRNPKGHLGNGLSQKFSNSIKVGCIPLYTLLQALDRKVVDFFSLDVEGSELTILKTVPFDRIIFKVIVLEVGHRESQEEIKDFMASNGYIFRKYFEAPFAGDLLFTHKTNIGVDWAQEM